MTKIICTAHKQGNMVASYHQGWTGHQGNARLTGMKITMNNGIMGRMGRHTITSFTEGCLGLRITLCSYSALRQLFKKRVQDISLFRSVKDSLQRRKEQQSLPSKQLHGGKKRKIKRTNQKIHFGYNFGITPRR